MRKVLSPFSYKLDSNGMEHNNGMIVTVPGQSMTPKEILRRFRAGMPLEGQAPQWDNDDFDDIDDPTRNPDFDLTDVPEYLERVKERKSFSKKKEVVSGANTIPPAPDSSPASGLPDGAGPASAMALSD